MVVSTRNMWDQEQIPLAAWNQEQISYEWGKICIFPDLNSVTRTKYEELKSIKQNVPID